MWLANGDVPITIPGGLGGVVIAFILAAGSVLVALLRRRRSDPVDPDAVRAAAEPAVDAAVKASTQSLAESLVKALGRIRELEDELDEAYQSGFKPRPRPSVPSKWQAHRDEH